MATPFYPCVSSLRLFGPTHTKADCYHDCPSARMLLLGAALHLARGCARLLRSHRVPYGRVTLANHLIPPRSTPIDPSSITEYRHGQVA